MTNVFERLGQRGVRARRLLKFLYVQRVKGFAPPTDIPHLDPETLDFLRKGLRRSKFYLEFGSGGSTVLADRTGVRTISIESDRFYAETVRKTLSSPDHIKVLSPNIGITGEWGTPLFKNVTKWRRYVEAPFSALAGEFPDLVLIDGRFRVACALETARRAKDANAKSLLIFDDYDGRQHYHVIEDFIGQPERVGRSAVFELGSASVAQDTVNRFILDPR